MDADLKMQAQLAWAELRRERGHGVVSMIARNIGVTAQCVWKWKAVPVNRVQQVAEFLEVPWQHLRPDEAERVADLIAGRRRKGS
jgi:hypothetical protein